MKITACEKAENCFSDEFVFTYSFDEGWTRQFIKSLETLGSLRYYESFPIPMFQVNCRDGTIIKGLENDAQCRVIFPRADPAAAKENFESCFGSAYGAK